MLKSLLEKLFNKKELTLSEYLIQTKKINISGVSFVIRKINIMDYIEGRKVLSQYRDVYKTAPEKEKAQKLRETTEKLKKFYKDIIMAGVVEPQIDQKDGGQGIFVERLFDDMGLCEKLVSEIVNHTHNNKKKSLMRIWPEKS
jgi:hypothetical protein